MSDIIIEFKAPADKAKPLAIVAAELAAAMRPAFIAAQHAAWKKLKIEHYIDLFDSHKKAFECTDSIEEYNQLRIEYIEELDKCNTEQEMFMVFLKAADVIMSKSLQIGNKKK